MATAATSFACTVDGQEHFVNERQELADDHPAVKAHPELFRQTAAEPADAKPAPKRQAKRAR